MSQHTCHIIGAAPLGGAVPRPQPGDYVIAADGGYAALQAIGVAPDFVMGEQPIRPDLLDFDDALTW